MNSTLMALGPGFGGDGGFWMIGADGKLHWVPPWSPDISQALNIATTLANFSGQLKDPAVSSQLLKLAHGVLSVQVKGIQQHVGNLTH